MHALIQYLLQIETPTVDGLMKSSGDDVNPKEASNVIQFCFVQLVEAINKDPEKKSEILKSILPKLINLLTQNQDAFQNPTYIATVFHRLGKITHHDESSAELVRKHTAALKKLFQTYSNDPNIRKDKAFSTLFQGLAELKDNGIFANIEYWQSEEFQVLLLNNLEKFSKETYSAEAIAIVMFGFSRLEINSLQIEDKQRLDDVLVRFFQSFMNNETFARKDEKPKAQEISNLVYAIAKLAKHGALIPGKWHDHQRQEATLNALMCLIRKKDPNELAISQIFYAVGKLAEAGCLERKNNDNVSVFWAIKPIIQYLLPERPNQETMIVIFTALGRLAKTKSMVQKDWHEKDKQGNPNIDLLKKLLNHINFTDPRNIADLYLSLGRLADAKILTNDLLQPHTVKLTDLSIQFRNTKDISDIYKRMYVVGVSKLAKIGFFIYNNEHDKNSDKIEDNDDDLEKQRSPSASPVFRSWGFKQDKSSLSGPANTSANSYKNDI